MKAPPSNFLRLIFLGGACAYFGCQLIRIVSSTIDWPMLWDSPPARYIAWRIYQGDLPYRDIVDLNFPGTSLIYLLGFILFGTDDFGFRLLDLSILALCIAAMVCFCMRRSLHTLLAGALGGILFAILHVQQGTFMAGQRDFMLIPFLIFALHFMALDAEKEYRFRRFPLAAGLSLGVAFLIKPIVIALLPISWLMMGLHPLRRLASRGLWNSLGFLVPLAYLCLWFSVNGALGPFLEILWHYVPLYQQIDPLVLRPHEASILLLSALAAMICLQSQGDVRLRLLCGLLLYSIFHFFIQRKGWSHHYHPFSASILLILAYTLATARQCRAGQYGLFALCLAAFAFTYRPGQQLYPEYFNMAAYTRQVDADIQRSLTDYRQSLSAYRSPRKIQFFDCTRAHLWNVAYRLKWIPASRQLYPLPFYFHPGNAYMQQSLQELLADIDKWRPSIIVFSKESCFHSGLTALEAIQKNEEIRSVFAPYQRGIETSTYQIFVRTF